MIVSTVASHQGHPGYSETMPCSIQSADQARRLVRTALGAWGAADELADDGALIITELVANAAQHTSSRLIRVSVSRPAPDVFRVEVVDRSKRLPQRKDTGLYGERGRGLALVDNLAERWGTDLLPFGKRVWGVLRNEAPA